MRLGADVRGFRRRFRFPRDADRAASPSPAGSTGVISEPGAENTTAAGATAAVAEDATDRGTACDGTLANASRLQQQKQSP